MVYKKNTVIQYFKSAGHDVIESGFGLLRIYFPEAKGFLDIPDKMFYSGAYLKVLFFSQRELFGELGYKVRYSMMKLHVQINKRIKNQSKTK